MHVFRSVLHIRIGIPVYKKTHTFASILSHVRFMFLEVVFNIFFSTVLVFFLSFFVYVFIVLNWNASFVIPFLIITAAPAQWLYSSSAICSMLLRKNKYCRARGNYLRQSKNSTNDMYKHNRILCYCAE